MAEWWPWAKGYSRDDFRGDLMGGLAVGVMLIPHAMAVAMIAGLPPHIGLYAALGSLILYAPFATSRRLTVGPVALDSLLVFAILSELHPVGSADYLALAAALAMLVGAMQIGLGVARLGLLVHFLSVPVLSGFMLGAPIIIALAQLKHLLGVSLPQSQRIADVLRGLGTHWTSIHWATVGIGLAAIALQLTIRKLRPGWPDILLMVVALTVASWLCGFERWGVAVVGTVPGGLPALSLPTMDLGQLPRLLPSALAIAVIGYMEGISIAKVYAEKYRHHLGENREMVALGVANLGASLVGGYPIGGSFARTAVNDHAGSRTPLANVYAALVVGLTLCFLAGLFYFMPKAVLAAVVIVAVSRLMHPRALFRLFRIKRTEGVLAVATFLATLGLGVLYGLLFGVVASVLPVLFNLARPHAAELGMMPDGHNCRDLKRFPEAVRLPGIFMVRIDASFCFLNAAYLRDRLAEMVEADRIQAVIIDASSINDLDATAYAVFERIVQGLHDRGILLFITGVKGAVRDIMKSGGLWEQVGAANFFLSPYAAIQYLRNHTPLMGEADGAGI